MVSAVSFRPCGAIRDLFFAREQEILLEGPAGCGKTRGVLEYVYWVCVTFPGVRILLVRKTRASLTESGCVTWEQRVLPDDACMRRGGSAEQRHAYEFPWGMNTVDGVTYRGRSRVVLGGMDKSSRIMSTEYDIIVALEARELSEEDWQALFTRCRNGHLPWNQIIADTNPDHEQHWLNRRAKRRLERTPELVRLLGEPREGEMQMRRLLSRHTDNPVLYDQVSGELTLDGAKYMAKLETLTGPQRGRLLRGEWVGAEGQVWEIFDRDKHMVYRDATGVDGTALKDGHRRDERGRLTFDWYFASFDWGHRAPGCLQVWGVVGKCERIYRIHEIYRRALQLDAWAEHVARFYKRYGLAAVVCDPSRPDLIEFLNRRLIEVGARDTPHLAIGGVQDKQVRIDTVRYGLAPGEGQGVELAESPPRLYLCWDALESPDQALAEEHKPNCTEDEIPGYVWAQWKDGKPVKEEPDRACPDHGCDATQYAAVWAFGKDLTPPREQVRTVPEDSIGAILEHDKVRFDDGA